ncbi:Transmembrane transporter [Gammaproteobacteria bacterium]
MSEHPSSSWSPLGSIITPLLVSILLGAVIFFGGDAFQIVGLAAVENTLAILGNVLGIVEFMILAVLIQRIVQYVILDRLVASALGTPTPRLLSQISAVLIYALAVAAIAGVIFKKDLTVVMATVGGAGIVIGLSLQRVIQDLFAGLNINLDQTLKKGYYIRLHILGLRVPTPVEGEVREISWRTTELLDTDGNTVLIPNSLVNSSILTNFSIPAPHFKIKVPVVLDESVPVEGALSILKSAALEASPSFSLPDSPSPTVTVNKITPHGIEYSISIYPSFKTRTKGRHLLLQQVLRHLAFSGYSPAREKQEQIEIRKPIEESSKFKHLAKLFGNTDLFQDLAEPELLLLAKSAIPRGIPANTVIVQAGELATFMFFVVEGLLTAKMRPNSTLPSAREEWILGPGTLANSTPLIAGGSYSATIRTKTKSKIYEMNISILKLLLSQKPECARLFSRRVAEQIQTTDVKSQTESENNLEALAEKVFKHMRRSFIDLNLD